jgi:hypothetical protein
MLNVKSGSKCDLIKKHLSVVIRDIWEWIFLAAGTSFVIGFAVGQIRMRDNISGLRIRITLIRVRIRLQLFTSMRILIQLLTLIRIRIQLLFNVMGIYDQASIFCVHGPHCSMFSSVSDPDSLIPDLDPAFLAEYRYQSGSRSLVLMNKN